MSNFQTIQQKLEEFIKRFYTNELLKGTLLFFAIGLLYLLATLFIEYMLWLSPTGRLLLFWLFIAVETVLFVRFIAFPLAKLFKLKKGIAYEDASIIIGAHFPQVNDKLLNILQLNQSKEQTELMLASIEQKSSELKPIPFKTAINFKGNIKYLKYAAIPVLIILFSYVSGKFSWFSDSYERVVNYKTAYEPPAPFQFFVINDNLQAIENQNFKLLVITEGEVIPQDAIIEYNGESYFMKQIAPGTFEYVFTQPSADIQFRLTANGVASRPYTIDVVEVPTLLNFDMVLDYPSHTRKADEVVKSTGNATVPQGTQITWQLKTKSTDRVTMATQDSVFQFEGNNPDFKLTQRLYKDLEYNLNTSNENLTDYESLAFSIDVVRDEHPELKLQMQQDSTDHETLYFYGQVSDDYGLKKLQLIYYPTDDEENSKAIDLPLSNGTFDEFVNIFPDQLDLEPGVSYQLYFQVFDNDAINRFKSTKSNVYTFRKLTKEEIEQNQLKDQNETIDDLNDSLEKFEEQDQQLKEISKTQKEKSELNFNDKKKLENFLERQMKQEEMMQNFNKKLNENLENFQNENENDNFKEDLQKRLQENQEQLENDEELLKELQKVADKINKEELAQKLEELAKQNKNKKRSMEQLLELTKRYYVARKTEKLKEELDKMAEDQEKLSEESPENNNKEEQDKLNEKFEEFDKELEDLKKDNEDLKEPMPLPKENKQQEDIKQEQKEASENLEKKEQSQDQQQQQQSQQNAKKKQKKAAQKMKQLSQQMSQMMAGGAGDQMSEDIEMLRQILDNLVLFSFDQEALMNRFKDIQINHNEYPKNLIKQQNLREHFEHVDDSLFALSLRQPMISERINKEITEVFFNIDKSLEQFSENRLYQGVAAQQYTVTAANTLASFLSDILDNMESQMNPSPGQGGGEDQQLPDIIMSQEQLNEMMKEQLDKQKGEQEGEKEGEKQGETEGDKKDGKNKGTQSGQDGDENIQDGEGESDSERRNRELFEIYKRQQQLRQALEDKLGEQGKEGEGKNLLDKMEEIERDLLNRGVTDRTMQKMMDLQHQLLKLENAAFQQGEDNKRESKTNKQRYNNTSVNQLPDAKQYFNTTEILNRQALPLQHVYKKKVQEYFKNKNDNF